MFHSGPGNAFAIDDKHRDRRELLTAQAIIKDRCARDVWQSFMHVGLHAVLCQRMMPAGMQLGQLRPLSFSCCTIRARGCSRLDPELMSRRLLPLVPAGVFYDVRIFLDTWNAPVSEVGTAVLRVAAELNAFAIVVAANDQVRLQQRLLCC